METQTRNPDSSTVTEHLEELRSAIISSIIYLSAGALLSFLLSRQLVGLLVLPARKIIPVFVYTSPTDVLTACVKLSLYAGLVLASPLITARIWKFIKPALPAGRDFSPGAWCIPAALLFAAGTLFSYTVALPFGLKFLIHFSDAFASPMITLNAYISFALVIMAIGGLLFEMPLASALLTRLGVITPSLMSRKRKEAIFAICALTAVLTPTTDVFNMLVFVVPMLVLFEVSILVSRYIYRPQQGDEFYEKQ